MGPEEGHQPKNQEVVIDNTFESRIAKTVNALIDNQAIKHVDSNTRNQSYEIDHNKAVQVLGKIKEQEESKENTFSETITNDDVQKAYLNTIRSLRDEDILDETTLALVGQIVPIQKVFASDSEYARAYYDGNKFPDTPQETGEIEIGQEAFNLIGSRLKKHLENNEVSLTNDQIKEVTLRYILAHEYGHLVDRATAIYLTGRNAEGSKDTMTARLDVSYAREEEIYETLAPNTELQGVFANEPDAGTRRHSGNDPAGTSSERIATGFEYIGLRSALFSAGVENSKVESIITSVKLEGTQKFNEQKRVLDKARDKGFTMETLGIAVGKLRSDLLRNATDTDKNLNELLRGGFDSRLFGYAFPLSEDEIRTFSKVS